MRRWQDAYFRHDSLAEVNEPLYFHQFVEQAEKHGLQFLAEAELPSMLASNLAAPVSETLHRLGRDIVELEQYMDFVRNRMFRQTLLCHRELKLTRALGPWTLRDFQVAALLQPVARAVDLISSESSEFRTSAAQKVFTTQPIVKAAFVMLTEQWPRGIPFLDLVAQSRRRLGGAGMPGTAIPAERDAAEVIGGALLTCLSKGACELHVHAGPFIVAPTERPQACAYARLQAARGTSVTNRRHECVELDNFGRHLLLRLDGQNNHDALVGALTDLTVRGMLLVEVDNRAVSAPAEVGRILAGQVGPKLQQLGQQALLVA
jgi:methyltransferase-like protein